MKKLALTISFLFCLVPLVFSASEISIGGATGAGHIIDINGTQMRQRPYLRITGDTVTGTDQLGRTVVTIDTTSSVEGTAVLSTGEGGGTKYLREDGDGTCSWQTPAGSGDLLADGSVPLTADWNAGNSLYDITAVEFKGALKGNADTVTNGVYTTNNLSVLAATTSAQLFGVLSDETGSGAGALAVFNISPQFETSINGNYLTASEILITDASKNIVSAAVATYPSLTELSYVKGLSSAVQTQLTAGKLEPICKTLETPADADNFLIHKMDRTATITSIECVVNAATSAVIIIQECDANGANCAGVDGATAITCATTNTSDDGTLSNAEVDDNDWLRLDVGTVTGTVGHVAVCVNF